MCGSLNSASPCSLRFAGKLFCNCYLKRDQSRVLFSYCSWGYQIYQIHPEQKLSTEFCPCSHHHQTFAHRQGAQQAHFAQLNSIRVLEGVWTCGFTRGVCKHRQVVSCICSQSHQFGVSCQILKAWIYATGSRQYS